MSVCRFGENSANPQVEASSSGMEFEKLQEEYCCAGAKDGLRSDLDVLSDLAGDCPAGAIRFRERKSGATSIGTAKRRAAPQNARYDARPADTNNWYDHACG
jgi:hypothetical protein